MKLTLNALFDYTNDDGIFTYLNGQNVPWKESIDSDVLDLDYHSKHGTRIVSKTVTSLLDDDGLSTSAKQKLAKLLYTKNKAKWDELWNSMSLYDEFNPLDNTNYTKTMTTTHEGEDSRTQNIGQKQITYNEGQQVDTFNKGSQSNTFTKGSQQNSQTKGEETLTEGAQSNTIGTHTDSKTIAKSASNSSTYSPYTQEQDVVGAHTDSYGQKINTNSSRSDSQIEGQREDTSSEGSREDSTTKGAREDTTTEGAQVNTDEGSNSFTDTTTITTAGNIGVTSSGQLIRDFRQTVDWQYFEIIYKDIDDILCIEVYGCDSDDFSDYNIVTPYKLPIASAQTLGGIKVGQNLSIASDGTLNAQAGGGAVESVNGKTGEVSLDYEDVGAASASDMTTAKADIVNIKLDINQLQGSVLDLTNRTSTNESDIVNIKLDINQLQGSVLGLHNDLLAVRQVPTGGTEGQVLTKGASGYDWQTPSGGGGSNPTGTIINFMGTTAPQGYLACDGSLYNIDDFQDLSNFINTQFGSKNYFGGDGTLTFAVPDLRGEFLRGAGTNGHTNQGNGSTVGTHQDATTHLMAIVDGNNLNHPKGLSKTNQGKNVDSAIEGHTATWGYRNDSQYTDGTTNPSVYTSRPTNTSILYCIKY